MKELPHSTSALLIKHHEGYLASKITFQPLRTQSNYP